MNFLYLFVAIAWVVTVGSAIYFKINWLGYDYNMWAIIFSALHGLLAAIIAMFGGNNSGVRNSAKASNGSTVIQAGGKIKIKDKVKSKRVK